MPWNPTQIITHGMGDNLSFGLNTLGPLCLWQCFYYATEMQSSNHAIFFVRIKKGDIFNPYCFIAYFLPIDLAKIKAMAQKVYSARFCGSGGGYWGHSSLCLTWHSRRPAARRTLSISLYGTEWTLVYHRVLHDCCGCRG